MTHDSALAPVDLSIAFATPTRAAGLEGLTRRAPEPDTASADLDPVVAPAPASGSARAGALPSTPSAAQTPVRSVTVYVAPALRAQLIAERDAARAGGAPRSTAGLVLEAVEAALPVLSDPTESASHAATLFSHRDSQPREPHVQLGMRLPSADIDILDTLADQHTAGNRSLLIQRALNYQYTQR